MLLFVELNTSMHVVLETRPRPIWYSIRWLVGNTCNGTIAVFEKQVRFRYRRRLPTTSGNDLKDVSFPSSKPVIFPCSEAGKNSAWDLQLGKWAKPPDSMYANFGRCSLSIERWMLSWVTTSTGHRDWSARIRFEYKFRWFDSNIANEFLFCRGVSRGWKIYQLQHVRSVFDIRTHKFYGALHAKSFFAFM